MYLSILSGVCLFSLSVSSALVSAPINLPSNALRPPQILTGPSLSSSAFDITSTCDGRQSGRGLKENSSRDISRHMRTDGYEEVTLRQGHTDPQDDWLLQIRWSSDDGLCYVQPQLQQWYLTASASLKETKHATYTLFLACVVGRGAGELLVSLVRLCFNTSLDKMPYSNSL